MALIIGVDAHTASHHAQPSQGHVLAAGFAPAALVFESATTPETTRAGGPGRMVM